jgi:DNA-binding CsgD family transcriptional regulator
MHVDVGFDDAVAGIYRAAAGEQDWRQALDPVAALFGARLAILQDVDTQEHRLLALQTSRNADLQDCALQYVRRYHLVDPRRAQLLDPAITPFGHWYHDHDHLDAGFVAGNGFYQQFLAGYRLRHVSARLMQPAAHRVSIFALELPPQRGPLDADERELIRRLGAHVDEALRGHERVRRLQAQALAGHRMLDEFAQPMWLIDADRFVRFANAAAVAEAARERCLQQRGTRLVATSSRLDTQLSTLLHALAERGHGANAVLAVPPRAGDPPLWLHCTLLEPQGVAGAFGAQPMVLVTLFDAAQVAAVDPFALSSLLDLTPAQARVAARLAAGATPQQIASETGTALSTVRTHLHAVLARVGVQRATELVRVLNDGHALWAGAAELAR